MSKSVSTRLYLSVVLAVSLLLLISGAVQSLMQRASLNRDLLATAEAVEARLALALPTPIWNLDNPQIESVLRGEMAARSIDAILVLGGKGVIAGVEREAGDKIVASSSASFDDGNIHRERPLVYDDNGNKSVVGTLKLSISQAHVQAIFRDSLIALGLQIVVLDILLIIILNLVLSRTILRPLRQARDAFRAIASGAADLRQQLDDSRNDEFGELARYFNTFVGNLRELFVAVRDQAVQVAAEVDALHLATNTISRESQLQSEIASATAATVQEVTVSINHIADNANDAEETARRTGLESQESANAVAMLTDEIGGMAGSVQELAQTLTLLGTRSGHITSIVAVITDIADQTNLLALNAAIEAARAGEQGRGFAVVADEVRKLAERTAKATVEITGLIEGIGTEIKSALKEMQGTQMSVSDRLNTSRKVVLQMSGIQGQMDSVVSMIREIAGATREQSNAMTDMSRSAEKVNRMALETDAAIQQASQTATTLNALSRSLQERMGRFSL